MESPATSVSVNSNTSNIDKTILRFQTDFMEKGQRKGVAEFNKESEIKHPDWLNPELIQIGQTYIRKHFFSIFFAHLTSLIFLLCYLPVRYTLLRTGRSDSKLKAFRRYLTTLIHIKGWYEGNLVHDNDPVGSSPSPAVQDIYRIRTLHCRISKSLSNKLYTKNTTTTVIFKDERVEECNNNNNSHKLLVKAVRSDLESTFPGTQGSRVTLTGHEPGQQMPVISQLDMAVTQFCFMGFISLFPKSFGIHGRDNRGLEGFVHVWALIGYHLGIEDDFNLGLNSNFQNRQLVLSQILLPNLQDCDLNTVKLWTSLAAGISSFVPCISLHAILLYIVTRLLNTQAVQIQNLFNSYDTLCYKLMNYCFNSWMSKSILRSILNSLLRLAVFLTTLRLATTSSSSSSTTSLQITTTTIESRSQPQLNNNNNSLPIHTPSTASPTSHSHV